MGRKKCLDETIEVPAAYWQQLLFRLIGGQGTPGAQPAMSARYCQTFEVGLTGFTKKQVAQEFLDRHDITVELCPLLG